MGELDELPVIKVLEPWKVATGTYAQIFDETGRQIGGATGTSFGRGRGIEVVDAAGSAVLRVRRAGRSVFVTDPFGTEVGQLVMKKHVFARPEWELYADGRPVARLPRGKLGGGLHLSVVLGDGTVVAAIDGKASVGIAIFDTEGSYVLRRFHQPDRRWGLLELGTLFGVDVGLRAADAAGGRRL